MVISASDKLNGKLVLNLKTVDDAEVHVFMMPKNFNADYGYIGLFENNDYYTYQSSGTYTAPSDWYFIVQYYSYYFDGSLSVSSVVKEYTKEDIDSIDNYWQPTGTKFVDYAAIAAKKAREEAEAAAKAKALAKALQDAKDEAERKRLKAAAARAAEVERQKRKVISDRAELARIKVQESKKADIKTI